MFTDFLRDQAFAIAWLGLMASAWFGWSQEDPKPSLRAWLGAGSVLGMLTAGAFGVLVWRNWATETALEGKYWVFGALVLLDIVLIGGGCLWLAKRGMVRWYGWWIAACVALHFIPLAWVLEDWSYSLLAVIQVAGLAWLFPRLKSGTSPTSRWACPWVGATLLVYALVSGSIFLINHGFPLNG